MAEKSLHHEEMTALIIEWARTHIDILPGEPFESYPPSSFWTGLYKSQARTFRNGLPQYYTSDNGLCSYFRTFGTNQEKNDFYEAQDSVLSRLQNLLMDAKAPLQPLFAQAIADFSLTKISEPRLLNYIRAYPEIYADVPALGIVFNYVPMALDVGQRQNIISHQEFGFALASHLREHHGWDMTPGRTVQLFNMWKSEEESGFINGLIAANKMGQQHKIRLDPENVERIKAYRDTREVINAESQDRLRRRPRRQAAPRFYQSGELDHTKPKNP